MKSAKTVLWIFGLLLFGCTKTSLEPRNNLLVIPPGFPEMEFPVDNPLTKASIDLGEKLFFENALSLDSTLNCGSCHKPHLAFADSLSTSPGVNHLDGTRNSPTLANVGYQPYYLKEGGVPTLEMQVLVPIQEHNEFANNILEIARRLNSDSIYVQLSLKAYGRRPDAFVITRSIANYERTLISGDSDYDRWNFGVGGLKDNENRGRELFFGNKAKCSECHGGFNFTSYEILNNGLYDDYADVGLFRLSGDSSDIGKFKVPSLRNIEHTSPYMHDGSLETLEDVLQHYAKNGTGHPNQDSRISEIALTSEDQSDLLAFLKTLTDNSFISR